MMRCEHDQVGAVLLDIPKHTFDRIRAAPDDLGHINPKFRHSRSWAVCRQEFPTRQGLADAWKFCPIPLTVIADMNERKLALGNERRFQGMRECDQTCFREIGRMKHSANDGWR